MSFDEDVKKVLLKVLEDCGGNRAAAASRLGINPVTFWMWVEGKRKPIREALSRAIDCSGARLLFSEPTGERADVPALKKQLEDKEREISELEKERDHYKAMCDAFREVFEIQNRQSPPKTASAPQRTGAEEKKNVA